MKSLLTVRPLWLAASLFLVGPWLRAASAQLLGPELQVNTYTTSAQRQSSVAADGSGNFVVVWKSEGGQDGDFEGVFGQRFDSAGSNVGSEFQVNSYTTDYQAQPSVAADGSGNFVVVWTSSDQDGESNGVFGQRFSSAGSKVGSEFQVNTYTTSDQKHPAVAASGAGNFVVVWQSNGQDGSDQGVFAQRFNSAGSKVGSELRANTYTTNDQLSPAVAADGAGSFVVVWHGDDQDGSLFGVFGQRFDSAGGKVGSEFQVNTYATDNQSYPVAAMIGSGNFVVVWNSSEQDGGHYGVFGQRFDAAGSKVGSEFQVNSFTTDYQRDPGLAADSSGNFVVAWGSRDQDGSDAGTIAQRFDSAGGKVGSEIQVNDFTTDSQKVPAVAADGSGNFVIAWQSNGQDDDSSYAVIAKQLTIALFADDFELGDACAWSANVGGGC